MKVHIMKWSAWLHLILRCLSICWLQIHLFQQHAQPMESNGFWLKNICNVCIPSSAEKLNVLETTEDDGYMIYVIV